MNPNDLATKYRLLNSSFKKTMIYHIGIDAGFFTEYTYMLHAMLYCLQHKIQFKLYSDDANFGWEKGWEDCFAPFCEQVHEPFHHTYNTHRLPSWQALMQDKKLSKTKLLKWKLKVTCKNIIGKALAFFTYGKPIRLNFQVTFNPNQHFHIPELGIDGDYLHTFQKLTEITWKLNDTTAQECRQFATTLQLPPQYAGCQIRGGDKITETNLLPPEHYIRLIKEKNSHPRRLCTDRRLPSLRASANPCPGHTLVHPLQPQRARIRQQCLHADRQRAETETNGTFPLFDTAIDGCFRLYRKYHHRSQPVPVEEVLSGDQSGRLSAQGLSASIRSPHSGTRASGHRIYARKLKVIVT